MLNRFFLYLLSNFFNMLEFNDFGYLIPDRNIPSSIIEFETNFKYNNARNTIYEKYISYCIDLKAIINKDIKQWIDGSYVTKKVFPQDIDIVSFINHEDYEIYEKDLKNFIYPNSKRFYEIDAYLIIVYPESHKKNFYYKSDYAEWLINFSRDMRTNNKKDFWN